LVGAEFGEAIAITRLMASMLPKPMWTSSTYIIVTSEDYSILTDLVINTSFPSPEVIYSLDW
jgi:hypothetical protein